MEAQLEQPLLVGWALSVLGAQGLIEGDKDYYRVTAHGLAWLADWEKYEARVARLAAIQRYGPQRRGKALEAIIADALRDQGCTCIEDTGAVGEQIDQVVQCGPSFFVCETKWNRDPVEGGVVSQMAGRMLRRPASFIGVIFSMSGFTNGARQTASQLANNRVILLIEPEDVRGIIHDERGFLDVVEEQQLGLAMRARL